jgi:O-methyltransferase
MIMPLRASRRYRQARSRFAHSTLAPRLARLWEIATFPSTVFYLLFDPRIHPAYGLTWPRKVKLAYRMWRTTRGVYTGTSYKAHLAMAVKLLQIPPEVEGAVVECGSYLGGSTANLSLACDVVGRDLIVYDSFEGLPPPTENDKYAKPDATGFLRAELEVVRDNVRRFGAIERCSFRKGWFSDTLPQHTEPIVLAFLDVDYQASLDDCIRNLWPHLTDRGYVFIDEYVLTDYCALFWSERYWRTHFDATPPGLIGAGSGVGVGQYYLGPFEEWNWGTEVPQSPTSVAYTRKDFSGYWGYYPDSQQPERSETHE